MGEKNGRFTNLVQGNNNFNKIEEIRAGKFRRYHNEGFIKKIFDFKTNILNVRDFFYFIVGFLQSVIMILRLKPQVVFIKGGYVGVPVGLACVITKRKYITHDSDTVPGLANKIIGRWAKIHAVGMPKKFYNDTDNKLVYTGIPVQKSYKAVSREVRNKYREQINIPLNAKVICVTGGSLGAVRLNNLCAEVLQSMIKKNKDIFVIHQTGSANQDLYQDLTSQERQQLLLESYIDDLHLYTGASDLVITRAGATTIASLAVQKIPLIVVPNPYLTGGHQMKNAEHLEHSHSAIVVSEDRLTKDKNILSSLISKILENRKIRTELENNISLLARPDAANKLSEIIYKLAKKKIDV